MLLKSSENRVAEAMWQNVGSANLKHTWTFGVGKSKHCAEIKVVSEHNVIMVRGPFHSLLVTGARVSDPRPVNCFQSITHQKWHPVRRQVHVDQEIQGHGRESGTSRSSSLHAA